LAETIFPCGALRVLDCHIELACICDFAQSQHSTMAEKKPHTKKSACTRASDWREDLAIFLEGRQPDSHYGTTDMAQIYMRLGDREHAIAWLQKGYAVHDPYLIFNLPSAPELDPIRSDPRVVKFLQALALPISSRS